VNRRVELRCPKCGVLLAVLSGITPSHTVGIAFKCKLCPGYGMQLQSKGKPRMRLAEPLRVATHAAARRAAT
jgi:hypothetical protein